MLATRVPIVRRVCVLVGCGNSHLDVHEGNDNGAVLLSSNIGNAILDFQRFGGGDSKAKRVVGQSRNLQVGLI